MFATGGDLNPSTRVKLGWGAVLGALGLVMILSDSIDAVKSIIALGALPFVFIVLLLVSVRDPNAMDRPGLSKRPDALQGPEHGHRADRVGGRQRGPAR